MENFIWGIVEISTLENLNLNFELNEIMKMRFKIIRNFEEKKRW
jgi:hypothetical protein